MTVNFDSISVKLKIFDYADQYGLKKMISIAKFNDRPVAEFPKLGRSCSRSSVTVLLPWFMAAYHGQNWQADRHEMDNSYLGMFHRTAVIAEHQH